MQSLSVSSSSLPVQGVRLLMEESSKIPNAIHLEVGEPNVNTPEHIRQAATAAMNREITHYTPNAGLISLRESIVEHLQYKYGLNLDTDQVVVTAGAVNALMLSIMAIVDSGEEVLIPDPAWPNYEMMLIIRGAVPKRYQLNPENGFIPDVEQLERLVTKKTKAILINSPGNPTGAVFDERTIKKLVEFASKYDLYVISDEVYDEIVFEDKHFCTMTFDNEERVISIFSFSKSYAMTGWRVGYAIGSKKIIRTMTKLIEPVISCAPSFAQKAAETALKDSDEFLANMRENYQNRRDKAYDIFIKNNVSAFKPKGTFYMLVDFSETDLPPNDIAFKLLREKKVSVGPGTTFGDVSKKMIRISLATEQSELLEGVERICNFINYHKKQ